MNITFTLGNVSPAEGDRLIRYNSDDGAAYVSGVRDMYFESSRTCDESEPMLYVDSAGLGQLSFNEKLLGDVSELAGKRSPDSRNIYNCVVVR